MRRALSRPGFLEPAKLAAALLLTHILWRAAFSGGPAGMVFFMGDDVSRLFAPIGRATASAAGWLLSCTGEEVVTRGCHLYSLRMPGSIDVVWSCSGLKQSLAFTLALLIACGPWRRKAWYLPLCLVALFLGNIVRVSLIARFTWSGYCSFQTAHVCAKYGYYFLLFFLWLLWQKMSVRCESDC